MRVFAENGIKKQAHIHTKKAPVPTFLSVQARILTLHQRSTT